MTIIEKKVEETREEVRGETYSQPLLTKHDALHALTGASGKSPNEVS